MAASVVIRPRIRAMWSHEYRKIPPLHSRLRFGIAPILFAHLDIATKWKPIMNAAAAPTNQTSETTPSHSISILSINWLPMRLFCTHRHSFISHSESKTSSSKSSKDDKGNFVILKSHKNQTHIIRDKQGDWVQCFKESFSIWLSNQFTKSKPFSFLLGPQALSLVIYRSKNQINYTVQMKIKRNHFPFITFYKSQNKWYLKPNQKKNTQTKSKSFLNSRYRNAKLCNCRLS